MCLKEDKLLTITSASALTIDTPNCSEVRTPVNGAIIMYYLEGATFGPITTNAKGNPIQDYTPDSTGILNIIASAYGNSAEVKVTIATSCNQAIGNCTDRDGDGVLWSCQSFSTYIIMSLYEIYMYEVINIPPKNTNRKNKWFQKLIWKESIQACL
ncbi:MAG: hypothetical protein ACE5KE_15340 [Methanosarcinales archaeon]